MHFDVRSRLECVEEREDPGWIDVLLDGWAARQCGWHAGSVDRGTRTAVCQTWGMPEWFSGDVVANGLNIHYARTGGDKPALVLSHGATDSGLCWTRVARALEADYDVIMPDARGHGLSDAPPSGYASRDRAADLASLIDALACGGRPSVAIRWALQRPCA